jgi:perosamine synthetase
MELRIMPMSDSPIREISFLRAVFPAGIETEVSAVLQSGYVGAGDTVDAFEESISDYLGTPAFAVTSSCTAALTLSYRLIGLRDNDLVLSTPMTCAATNVSLLHAGAKIGWLDVDPSSGNITPDSVKCGFDRYPDARAVVIMDWGGTPCDYSTIANACHSRSVPLVLDAAQSFGTTLAGKRYCNEVDYTCYSFGPTKLLTSVEGGGLALGTKMAPEINHVKSLRWYGIRRETRDRFRFWEYSFEDLGFRFVLNNVFAGIGLKMLKRVDERLAFHRSLAMWYDELLAGTPGLRQCRRPASSLPNFWLYTVLVEQRERFLTKLHSSGIHAAIPHRRNDRLLAPWNRKDASYDLPGVDSFDRDYVCLPIGPWVNPEDVEQVCALIKSGW